MKYTVTYSKELEKARANPEVIDACLRIESSVPYIFSLVDRFAHEHSSFDFPPGLLYLKGVCHLMEQQHLSLAQAKRMTAFLCYCPVLGVGTRHSMLVEIFGKGDNRILSFALIFSSSGRYNGFMKLA